MKDRAIKRNLRSERYTVEYCRFLKHCTVEQSETVEHDQVEPEIGSERRIPEISKMQLTAFSRSRDSIENLLNKILVKLHSSGEIKRCTRSQSFNYLPSVIIANMSDASIPIPRSYASAVRPIANGRYCYIGHATDHIAPELICIPPELDISIGFQRVMWP